MEFTGHIEDGKLKLHNRSALEAYIAKQSEGQQMVVRVGRETRSARQNRYYWGQVLRTIADETGHSIDYLHELFKQEFLGQECEKTLGRPVWKTKSSKSLDTKEFTQYIEQIAAFVGDYGISIPQPGE